MKRSKTSVFIAIILGILLCIIVYFVAFEIWINWQHSRTNEIEPVEEQIYHEYEDIVDSVTGNILSKIEKQESENCYRSVTGKCHLASEEQFGPLKLGDFTLNGEGMGTPLDNKTIPQSKFYIYVQRRGLSMCEFDNCGIAEGKVVQCMGGWLSGDESSEVSYMVGLGTGELSQGKASIVIIANSDSKIIGIFPYHTESDILPLLYQYPDFREPLYDCIDEEIGLSSVRELRPLPRPENVPELSGAELQVWMEKSKKIAILMPDGSFQDTKGQILYEPYFTPSEERYRIYRTGHWYFVKEAEDSEVDLQYRQKEDAIEWIKNEMIGRGYSIIDF